METAPPLRAIRIGRVSRGFDLEGGVERAKDDPGGDHAVPLVQLELHGDGEVVGQLGVDELSVHPERDSDRASRPALQPEPGVPVRIAHRMNVGDPRRRDEQPHAGVAVPERGQARELLGDVVAEALPSDHRVDHLGGRHGARASHGPGMREEGLPEGIDAARLDLEPRGRAVASIAGEVLAARVERGEQVEPGDAPARSPPVAVRVDPDQADGDPVALGQARRGDPHHPVVPALPREHQSGSGGQVRGERRPFSLGARDHLPLGVATLNLGELRAGRSSPRFTYLHLSTAKFTKTFNIAHVTM